MSARALVAQLALVAAAAAGCDRGERAEPAPQPPSTLPEDPATPPPPAPTQTPAAPGQSRFDLGGAAALGPASARREEALAWLQGQRSAADLPELASDPGVKLEPGLEARLGRPPGRALVTIGALKPASGLPTEEARERVEQIHDRLERCYARALAERPTLRGSIVFELGVAWEGNVDRVAIQADELGDGWLVECLRRSLEGIRFDERREATGLALSFDLSPGWAEPGTSRARDEPSPGRAEPGTSRARERGPQPPQPPPGGGP